MRVVALLHRGWMIRWIQFHPGLRFIIRLRLIWSVIVSECTHIVNHPTPHCIEWNTTLC
jgi:hypothetical protein